MLRTVKGTHMLPVAWVVNWCVVLVFLRKQVAYTTAIRVTRFCDPLKDEHVGGQYRRES